MTIADLFPGNMGRVLMTRVAIRTRMPALMKMTPDEPIDEKLLAQLRIAIEQVKRG